MHGDLGPEIQIFAHVRGALSCAIEMDEQVVVSSHMGLHVAGNSGFF